MLSTVALVGRPNVGKSTLFNRLTRSRDALVADHPGVTRDRRYGLAQTDSTRFLAIDTGGLGPSDESSISSLVVRQVEFALAEADAIVLVVDHKEGLTPEDIQIAERFRRSGKPIIVAVNKCEGVLGEVAEAEFHALGLGRPLGISALSGQGIDALVEQVASYLPESIEEGDDEELGPRIAVVGRPNVGKSTLINRLLGSDRLVTSDVPGTTRDSVFVPCERDGRKFVLIDTAGIRRRARVSDALEKYSIVQSLQAISDARVVIMLLDATEGVTDQDLHLIGVVVEQGRALVIGINKWDGLATRTRNQVLRDVDRQLVFVGFAEVRQVSALHGSGIAELLHAAFVAYESAGTNIPTPRLNEVLARILRTHPPPMVRGRRIKLRYAHQGGRFPPTIVIHGTQADRAPLSYRRYLENAFREVLRLRGTPVRIELRSGENPFAGRRNKLTPRQVRHRERLVRHNRRK
jgi:GTP-binding protein